jgi:hypothetical protein
MRRIMKLAALALGLLLPLEAAAAAQAAEPVPFTMTDQVTKEKPGFWTRRRRLSRSGAVRISTYFRTL